MLPFHVSILALAISTASPTLAACHFRSSPVASTRDGVGAPRTADIAACDTTDYATIVSRSDNGYSPNAYLLFRRTEDNILRTLWAKGHRKFASPEPKLKFGYRHAPPPPREEWFPGY
ncbi:hypothetical protein F5148DRAFT_1149613 [Russula earlei]|uniref:Uncharacterized protein n=1 Tax=Russula earlei TaxID=71964 RepID=A0ACC0U7F9_9AGAM|nr:hypothetical protein F5148DRAFT_1149613 [Russula earlei]